MVERENLGATGAEAAVPRVVSAPAARAVSVVNREERLETGLSAKVRQMSFSDRAKMQASELAIMTQWQLKKLLL